MRNEKRRVFLTACLLALITIFSVAFSGAAGSTTVADSLPSFSQLIKQITPAVVNISDDVILSVNRRPVNNVSEFKAAVAASKKGQPLLLLINRELTSLFVTVERP
jgi:S1-C subfamily serine protease